MKREKSEGENVAVNLTPYPLSKQNDKISKYDFLFGEGEGFERG